MKRGRGDEVSGYWFLALFTLVFAGASCCARRHFSDDDVLNVIQGIARQGERTALLVDSQTKTGHLALLPRCIPAGPDVWSSMPFPDFLDKPREFELHDVPLRAAIGKISKVYGVPIQIPQAPEMEDEWFTIPTLSLPKRAWSLRACLVQVISVMEEIGLPEPDEAVGKAPTQIVIAVVKVDRIEIMRVGLK